MIMGGYEKLVATFVQGYPLGQKLGVIGKSVGLGFFKCQDGIPIGSDGHKIKDHPMEFIGGKEIGIGD